jgi:hypothetical protein
MEIAKRLLFASLLFAPVVFVVSIGVRIISEQVTESKDWYDQYEICRSYGVETDINRVPLACRGYYR